MQIANREKFFIAQEDYLERILKEKIMFDLKQLRKPGIVEALVITAIILFMLGFPIITIEGVSAHIPVLVSIIFLLIYGWFTPYRQAWALYTSFSSSES